MLRPAAANWAARPALFGPSPAAGCGKLRAVHRTILLQAEAPPKPALGQPCNGCGLCCAVAPCPVGMLLSGRRQGPCSQLRWQADAGLYRCGLLVGPPRPLLTALARRWIAAGAGCDCDWQPITESGGT